MNFHREGRASIIVASLVSIGILFIAYVLFKDNKLAQVIGSSTAALLMLTILQFFRKPSRRMLTMEDAIIAPADGKVVVIEEVNDPEYFDHPMRQISIFMSPTNVHINWFPIGGRVVYTKYHPGKYLVAWDPKSSTDNERFSVVVHHPRFGDVLIKQIAGALARRIVNYASKDSIVVQGQELGFIKFGSRVDLLLPLEANLNVQLGEKTIGGQTIIATLPSN